MSDTALARPLHPTRARRSSVAVAAAVLGVLVLVVSRLGHDAQPGRFVPTRSGFAAPVVALGPGVRATVDGSGLALAARGRQLLSLRLAGYASGAVRARAAGADIMRPGLRETWAPVPAGLEQTFVVTHRLTGPLTLRVGGVRPRLRDSGAVLLGRSGLTYSGLQVSDAARHRVPAHLDVRGNTVRIVVDDRGARYPLTVDPVLQKEFVAADGGANSYFGAGLALSADGTVAAILGAGQGSDSGHVYVYRRSGPTWSAPTEFAPANQRFSTGGPGIAVSGDGQTLAVNAYPLSGSTFGHSYIDVYTGGPGAWAGETPIVITDPPLFFGAGQLALSRNGKLLVAADAPSSAAGGSTLVWTGDPATWPAETPITLHPPQAQQGVSIGLAPDGNTLALGETAAYLSSKGSVSVYTGPASTWSTQTPATFTPAEAHDAGGANSTGSSFGRSVAISADAQTLAVDAPQQGSGGTVYVYTGAPSTWAAQAPGKLTPPAGTTYEGQVALAGPCAVLAIGNGSGYPENYNNGAGAVKTYSGPPSGWPAQAPTLIPSPDTGVNEFFGDGLALSADSNVLLTSAPSHKVGANAAQGSAYAYGVETGTCPDPNGGTATATATASPSTSATATATAPPAATPGAYDVPPTADELGTALGLPASTACVKQRKLRFRLAKHIKVKGKTVKIASAKVLLGKKVVKRKLKAGKKVTVRLKRVKGLKFTIRLKATTTTGKKVTGKKTYRFCSRKKKHKKKKPHRR